MKRYDNSTISLLTQAHKLIKHGIIKFDGKLNEYYIDYNIVNPDIPLSLGLDDVAILQNKNICKSRLDADIKSEVFRGTTIDVPLLASNMSSVVNAEVCIKLRELGALGVMHRALPDEELISEVKQIAEKCNIVCASIGINDDQFDLAKKLADAGANVIFIDVAHGYSDFVINLGRKIKNEISGVKVVIGNTINTDMMLEVDDFADAVKVGVGNGAVCKTKNTASCNEKQFTSIYKFKDISKKLGLPIISDGSVREAADFVKAIAAGANSVMAGSIFARCPESAAEVIEVEGIRKKLIFGMASRFIQNKWKGGVKTGTCPEGKVKYLDLGEPLFDLIERYSGALRSGITYGGANNIIDFQKLARFVRVR
jgi:IMP dehydrogenase/GMP reductase